MAFNMDAIIDKVVVFLIIVGVVPGALITYFQVSTTQWDTATIAIWGILAILFVVSLFKYIRPSGKGR